MLHYDMVIERPVWTRDYAIFLEDCANPKVSPFSITQLNINMVEKCLVLEILSIQTVSCGMNNIKTKYPFIHRVLSLFNVNMLVEWGCFWF